MTRKTKIRVIYLFILARLVDSKAMLFMNHPVESAEQI